MYKFCAKNCVHFLGKKFCVNFLFGNFVVLGKLNILHTFNDLLHVLERILGIKFLHSLAIVDFLRWKFLEL